MSLADVPRTNASEHRPLAEGSRVHSFDEWSTLREVVVGRADHYDYHHVDVTFKLFYLENVGPLIKEPDGSETYVSLEPKVLEELQEDIEGFVEALRAFGTIVHRPEPPQDAADIATPFWVSRATPPLNVRDLVIILGDTIVETATHVRSRYFETTYLKPLFYKYFAAGSPWIAMPQPVLTKGSVDVGYYLDSDHAVPDFLEGTDARPLPGLPHELIFDGAQCIRFGADVFVNVSNANHELGYRWLTQQFGNKLRFHRLYRFADNHMDTTLLPLRPGLLLLRSRAVRDRLPSSLASWDVVYAPDIPDDRFPQYGTQGFSLTSNFIDLNVLSLDEDTVIVNSLYPELIDALSARGMEVVPVRHRHRGLFSGGFHCFTLDCVRDGGPESYLD